MRSVPALRSARSDIGGEELVRGSRRVKAHDERPMAIVDTDLGPLVDRVDGDIALRRFGDSCRAAGRRDYLPHPTGFNFLEGGCICGGNLLGHFWNLVEFNSRNKPSEFHTENNSSFYTAGMKDDSNLIDATMTWNDRMIAARKVRGWSRRELARQITAEDQDEFETWAERLNSYEKKGAKRVDNPRGDNLEIIAATLGVNVEWLKLGIGKSGLPSNSLVNDPETLDTSVIASSGTPPLVSPPENAAKVNEPFPKSTVRKWIYELGRAAGGREGKFILNGEHSDRVLCPPELENSTAPYLVRVYGTSMVPRFRNNERLQIDPDEPYGKGDDVVVQLHTDDETVFECYVKQFVSMNAKELVVEQLNPPAGAEAIIRFPRARVYKIHKVVGLQMATRHQI
jgi:phage repressor protein C with HTH and peptisase S24 domain